MPPPLFTVDSNESNEKPNAAVNLLPCRIQYDGDVKSSDTFWNPSPGPSGENVAYLRGRKLHGKCVKLPQGYCGSVVQKTDPKPEPSNEETNEDVSIVEDPEDQLEIGAMEGRAGFEEIIVWGHESTTESTTDPYIRGIEEWIAFTEEIHSYDTESNSKSTA
ncbi:ribonuclease H2, subunit C [Xylariaceae sp. FL1019]|nr:ribonuclease H2, subunit C [Xylariaceae sp. FL1019]